MNFAQAAPEAVTTVIATSVAVPTDVEGVPAVEATVTSTTAVVTSTAEAVPEAVTTAVTAAAAEPEWWQSALTPMGYVLAAIIAGSFAVKLSRKTPHENLKALVEIRQTLDEDDVSLDKKGVLDTAIGHELNNIAALTAARKRGRWAYVKAAARIGFGTGSASVTSVFLGTAALAFDATVETLVQLLHKLFGTARPKADERPSDEERPKAKELPSDDECPPDKKSGEHS